MIHAGLAMRGQDNNHAEATGSRQGAPILVVDDTAIDLKFMRLLLTYEGYSVRTAKLAEEALELLSTFRPELILTDIRLPGMDGLELTKRIKQDPRTQSIKVVAVSAYTGPGDEQKAINAGCDGYLTKPIDSTALTSRVRHMLQRSLPPPKLVVSAEPAGVPTISETELEHLRRGFLHEGSEEVRYILDNLESHFDVERTCSLLHGWVSTGGFTGCQEISRLARVTEELLRAGNYRTTDLRESLGTLLWAFADLLSAVEIVIPEHVARGLRGRSVALIGCTPARANFLRSAFEQVTANTRVLRLFDRPEDESIEDCDLAIMHVGQEALASGWLTPEAFPSGTALIVSGTRRERGSLAPALQARASHFLVETWDPEEVLMEAYLAVSRRPALAVTPAQQTPAEMSPVGQAQARTRVLIADDDALILTVVGSTIENYGMSCQRVDNGEDALRQIRELLPQIAVLDVNMPGLDGFEVLAAVRAEKLPVLVVLLTARQREGDILRGFQLGADDYLVKPFNPLELMARLRRLVRK